MRTVPLGDSLEALASAVLDSRREFGVTAQIDLEYSLHMQLWSDGGCGFKGQHTNVSTMAPCVVVTHRDSARVYHNGRFAYQVDQPTNRFRKDKRNESLMGQARFNDGDGIFYFH